MPTPTTYRFADLTLDTGLHRLERAGEPIELGKLTFELLVALIEAAPNLLTHDELVQRVWGGRMTSPETVTQRIKLLRDALGDDAENPRYVGIVRGLGYRLLPTVQIHGAASPIDSATGRSDFTVGAPDTAVPASGSAPSSAWAPRSVVRIGAFLAVLLVLAIGVLSVGNYLGESSTTAPETVDVVAAFDVSTPGEYPAVAVLPFVNDSPDPDQQYFADGLSGELINALGRIPDLAVRGRTSSFYFKGKNADLQTIGDALNVGHVLSGSVQRSGEQVRIAAELVDVRTGLRLWGSTYVRTFEDIFAIQDDITEHVAAALQITLGVGRLGRVSGMPQNVAAYEEMLKGVGYLREGRPDSLQPAIDHFLQATQLDETSSVAWISLANSYAVGSSLVPPRAAEWRPRAREAAERARALTPQAIHVLLWDAQRTTERGAWSEAAKVFDELTEERYPLLARKYGPNAEPWVWKAVFLLQVGRVSESITHWEVAKSTDPLNAATARLLGDAYADSGDLSRAFAEIDRGIELGWDIPALQGYALAAALASGDRDEIERRTAVLWPSPATDAHIRMARYLDDPAGAVAELRNYVATEPAGPDILTPLVLAHWAGYYKDAPTALALLRRIPRSFGTSDIAVAIWRPLFSDMRKLPEFNELVREIGLVDYWRAHSWPDFCEPVGETFTCH